MMSLCCQDFQGFRGKLAKFGPEPDYIEGIALGKFRI